MAKLECQLRGNFSQILHDIDNAVMGGSISASCEDASNFDSSGARCAVRVYERYSYMGGNRVSLNLTLFQNGNQIYLSAITAGGSQAVFFKLNTFGEEAFLDTIRDTVEQYRA